MQTLSNDPPSQGKTWAKMGRLERTSSTGALEMFSINFIWKDPSSLLLIALWVLFPTFRLYKLCLINVTLFIYIYLCLHMYIVYTQARAHTHIFIYTHTYILFLRSNVSLEKSPLSRPSCASSWTINHCALLLLVGQAQTGC